VPTVRCPRCGTINPDGRRPLARCRRCHEALGKCRYCHHYDARIADCTHPSRPADEHISDADEVLNCPLFASRLTGAPAPRALGRLVRTGFLAAALATLGIIVALRLLSGPSPPPAAALRVSASVPASSFQEEGFPLVVLVKNESDHRARDVRVRVSGRSLAHLTCQYCDPPEAFLEASPQQLLAALGDLPPGEIGAVTFQFTAGGAGEFTLAILVTAANLPAPARASVSGEVLP